jgi:hypothetical protein
VVGGLYKFANPVVTQRPKACPVSTLEPIQ